MSQAKLGLLEFLLQLDLTDTLLPVIGKNQWQTLYLNDHGTAHSFVLWCALLDAEAASKALLRDSWEVSIGEGRPGFGLSSAGGKELATYSRFSSDHVRPFLLARTFNGAFSKYVEVNEEFRLYHNLAEDKTRGLLLDFDASGREIEVVRIEPTEVRAQLKYLRQFQAGTGLHLAVYIDSRRFSKITLDDVPSNERERVEVNGMVRWRRNVAACDFKGGHNTFSRLLSKVILEPPAQERAGIWPFTEDNAKRAVMFVIKVDQEGNEIEHTSDPEALSNYFGANPGAPHYLTPVYFRREVLVKYFAEPERYDVSDGRLTCLSLWSCQIDNDLDSHVVVFLGDLGRDLPYEERLHWRQFNVAPEGRVSTTNFRRSFLAQFADAQSPDLAFRQEYAETMQDWEMQHGWQLFLAPGPGDSHLLNTVRIPVTNSQPEFDEQIGNLAKLLVDCLNEKEIAARTSVLEDSAKGITKLSGFFEESQFPERQRTIHLLRDLQTLRSAGSAHRKGSAYEKIVAKLGVDPTKKADAVRRLLQEATQGLRAIRQHYCGKSGPSIEPPHA